jgi:hypothetical protein
MVVRRDFKLDEPCRIPLYGYVMPSGTIIAFNGDEHPSVWETGAIVHDISTGESAPFDMRNVRVAYMIRTQWMTLAEGEE